MTLPGPKIYGYNFYHNIASCPISVDLGPNESYNATLFVGQMGYGYLFDVEASLELPPVVQILNNEGATMRRLKPRNDWAVSFAQGFVTHDLRESRYRPLSSEEEWLLRTSMYGQCLGPFDNPYFKDLVVQLEDEKQVKEDEKQVQNWVIPTVVVLIVAILVSGYFVWKNKKKSQVAMEEQVSTNPSTFTKNKEDGVGEATA
jgi:hypothetical protein